MKGRGVLEAAVFVIVYVVLVPVVYVGMSVVVPLAYGEGPLRDWWEGPLGFVSLVVASFVLPLIAAGMAVQFLRDGTKKS